MPFTPYIRLSEKLNELFLNVFLANLYLSNYLLYYLYFLHILTNHVQTCCPGNGEIDFDEFCTMMENKLQYKEDEVEVLDAFKVGACLGICLTFVN